jgi:cold shock CspA family protein/ribosome-associated translation inhibitor RaiA
MQIPMQITFRGFPPSEAVEHDVRMHAGRLDRFCDRIVGCRVMIEAPHRHQHQGKLFHVRIDLTVPGGEIVVNREPAAHHAHEDVHVAIRDAFDAARRQLEDTARRQRGAVKLHEPRPLGRIRRLFPEQHYGFIETADGREIYFHRHSVLGGAFGRLQLGTDVEFVEERGEKGPQATTVRMLE